MGSTKLEQAQRQEQFELLSEGVNVSDEKKNSENLPKTSELFFFIHTYLEFFKINLKHINKLISCE